MPSITHQSVVGPVPTQYYGSLILSNIQYDDGSQVTINSFLGVTFKSPGSFAAGDVAVSTSPWQDVTPDLKIDHIDASTYFVTAKLQFPGTYTFNTSDTITFGISGDLTQQPDIYTESFLLAADALPDTNGTVDITVAAAPDPAFDSSNVVVTFQQGLQKFPANVPLGLTTPVQIPAGAYVISAVELTTEDQTTVAASHISPASLAITTGETTSAEVTFGSVSKYSAVQGRSDQI